MTLRLLARIAVLVMALLVTVIALTSHAAHADPFNNVIELHVTMSGTDHNATPDLTVQVNVDCPSGVCPASSSAPMPDVMLERYSSNFIPCRDHNAAPCSGISLPIDALVGNLTLQMQTNVVAALAPDNVNPSTGVPTACGGAGTTPVSATVPLISGAYNTADLVAGRDSADADALPDTQGDARGLTPASPPNGAPDGADAMPDYLKPLLDITVVLVSHRYFAIVPIGNTGLALDVNVVTIDLTSYSSGFVVATTIGDVFPLPVGNANAPQSIQTCTPYSRTVTTSGHYSDNPATASDEGAGVLRFVVGQATDPIHYAVSLSGQEDVDGDGVAAPRDRCANPSVGAFPSANSLTATTTGGDADGDGIGDSCDPDPGTRDNCPGTPFVGKSAACAGAGGNPATYPTKASGCSTNANTLAIACAAPWNPDQDIDGDSFPNWSDNCPTAYNPQQIDRNADSIGDACQPAHPTAAGARPDPPSHDHDDYCDGTTTVGGPTTLAAACYAQTAHAPGMATAAPLYGTVQDSNDDGFEDWFVIADPAYLPNGRDKNTDTDADGCTDYAEVHASPGAACAGDPLVPNSNGGSCVWTDSSTHYLPVAPGISPNSCVDGNKDRNGNGIADWRDDVTGSPQDDVPGPTFGSPDSDGDGCTNRREALPSAPLSQGGGRNAANKWDFFDVETITMGVLSKNRAVSIADTIAILSYIGVNAANPNTANANGHTYAGDDNNDGAPNGEVFDRSPAGSNGVVVLTGAPNGAVSIADAISNLNQIGANCTLI